ncbi:YceI family protein [Kribbella solani]|uniref:Polyisoprenoid-binding protein YceI n=1 Tax=Kribbella solani TaxID=236067 RepID=A0A841DPY2_9ACTN|nr:YceI family protein [Kribbella solani]MBB5981194.1 polyisoprenoid-binding protein YceI [Kribbella solani]
MPPTDRTPTDLTGDYVLDPTRTRIAFTAAHRFGPTVQGHFTTFKASLHLNATTPTTSTAHLTIQSNSLTTNNPRRDTQLHRDFLNTPTHPQITFTTTTITPTHQPASQPPTNPHLTTAPAPHHPTAGQPSATPTHLTDVQHFVVSGDLTIRGTTHPITIPLTVTKLGPDLHFHATTTLNRHTWHANWNPLTTALVHPHVTLTLDLLATRP